MLWLVSWGIIAVLFYVVLKGFRGPPAAALNKDGFDPNSLDAFLHTNYSAEELVKAAKPQLLVEDNNPGRAVLVFYGTEYGASKEIAFKLGDRLNEEGVYKARVINLIDHKAIDFSQEQAVMIVCSTAGDGVPPTEAKPFFEALEESSVVIPAGLPYSVLALGDSNYPHFCRCGRTIDAMMAERGAVRFFEKKDVDQEDWGVINSWIAGVHRALKGLKIEVRDEYLAGLESIAGKEGGEGSYSRSKPFMAPVAVKRTITKVEAKGDSDVMHIEFDLSGSEIKYVPGDALGVCPSNNPKTVAAILKRCGWSGKEKVAAPAWYPKEEGETEMPLKDALAHCYDLKTVRGELLRTLVDEWLPAGSPQGEKARGLLAGGLGRDNGALAGYLEPREVLDVLEEHPAAAPAPAALLKALKQLLPRYYSISSSPLHNAERVSITAGVVRYETLGKGREGVCTTFLSDRVAVGAKVPIFISPNKDFRLPADLATPIIMIGPGTGLAPFRSFLQHRELAAKEAGAAMEAAANVLFFGCRHEAKDFLYRDELTKLADGKKLRLHTAFSRDQAAKVYVQQRLREAGPAVWQAIAAGGHVYVCGDAKHMAADVHAALLEVAADQGGLGSLQAAQALFDDLVKQHRYQRDVWA
eukprot:tig00001339_g8270.t1